MDFRELRKAVIEEEEKPRVKKSLARLLKEACGNFDDLEEISPLGQPGDDNHHPYADSLHEHVNSAADDIVSAMNSISVARTSSPGHEVNSILKKVEEDLQYVLDEFKEIINRY